MGTKVKRAKPSCTPSPDSPNLYLACPDSQQPPAERLRVKEESLGRKTQSSRAGVWPGSWKFCILFFPFFFFNSPHCTGSASSIIFMSKLHCTSSSWEDRLARGSQGGSEQSQVVEKKRNSFNFSWKHLKWMSLFWGKVVGEFHQPFSHKKPLENQQNTEKTERLADSREGELHQG